MEKQLRERLINLLLVLLILVAALFLAQMLWQVLSGYADLLLLFVLGWLVSFVLNPIVFQLSHQPVPKALEPALQSALGKARSQALLNFRLSRDAAVIVVYLILVLAIVIAIALFAPTAIAQLTQLAKHLPEYAAQIPEISAWVQIQIAPLGVRLNVNQLVQSGLGSLQSYAAAIIQNALGIFTSLLSFLANLFFVLILGFYITLDGPRFNRAILKRVPENYHNELNFFSKSVDRTFGGFIRGQLIQAMLIAIGTALAMTGLGLNYVLVATLFAGLFMLIPLVGPFLALIPPGLVGLLQMPELALWLLLALFIYQFVIVNILMPRVMSDAVGLHPLLVLGAILISVRIAGFWGAFFGIPVAGVLWAMALFLFEQWRERAGTDSPPSA